MDLMGTTVDQKHLTALNFLNGATVSTEICRCKVTPGHANAVIIRMHHSTHASVDAVATVWKHL